MAENYENHLVGAPVASPAKGGGVSKVSLSPQSTLSPQSHSNNRKRKSTRNATGGKSDANDATAAGAEPKKVKASSAPTRESSRNAAGRKSNSNDAKAGAYEGRLRRRCPAVDNASDAKENQAPGSKGLANVAAEPDDEDLLQGLLERAEQIGISGAELTELIQKSELDIDALAEIASEGTEKALGVEELWEGEDAAKPKRAPAKNEKKKKKRKKRPGRPPVSNDRMALIGKNLLKHGNTERGKRSRHPKKVILPPPSKNNIIDPKDLPEKLRKKVASIAGRHGYDAALLALGVTPSEFGKMGYKVRVDKKMKERGVDRASAKTLIGQEMYAGARAKAKKEGSTSKLRCPEVRCRETNSEGTVMLTSTHPECGHSKEIGDEVYRKLVEDGSNPHRQWCPKCKEYRSGFYLHEDAQQKAASGTYQCKACKATTVVKNHKARWNKRLKKSNRTMVTCKSCKAAGKGGGSGGGYPFYEKFWKEC